jgi:hypothetical protein
MILPCTNNYREISSQYYISYNLHKTSNFYEYIYESKILNNQTLLSLSFFSQKELIHGVLSLLGCLVLMRRFEILYTKKSESLLHIVEIFFCNKRHIL